MKAKDIKVGGHYLTSVNGRVVTVRVEEIFDTVQVGSRGAYGKGYEVTNLATGRKTTFRSARKFRLEVPAPARKVTADELVPLLPDCPTRAGKKAPPKGKPLADVLSEDDTRNRTPDAELDASERDNQPEEVARNRAARCPSCHSANVSVSGGRLICHNSPLCNYRQESEPTDNQEIERLELAVRRGDENCSDPTLPTSDPRSTPATNGRAQEPEAAGLKGDQLGAFEEVTARLDAKQTVTKLVGYAGSGKTWLLARIAKWAVRKGFEVTVAAPTHKAAGVIKDKLGDSRIQVRTIHSLLGLRLEPDWESDSGGRILQAQDSKSKVKRGLVICDEASMVGETLKEHIDKTAGVSWLFVGDLAQLPPVGESISKMLSDPDATLEQVLRQAQGSEILNLATRIRRGDQSMEFEEGKDVYRVGSAEDLFQAALKRFDSDDYRKDASHARMLVFKNRRREALNRRMRSLLVNAGPDQPYTAGEWLVMYAQFSPEKSRLNLLAEKAKQYKKGDYGYGRSWKEFFNYRDTVGQAVTQLHVSEEVLVGAVGKGRVEVGQWGFNVWKLQVTTKGGGSYELPVLMDDCKDLYMEVLKEQVEEAQNCRQARDQYGKGSAEWLRFDESRKKAWGVYFTLEEMFAQVDYAYAMTVHKSQGSTFDHVFVDVPDLLTAGGMIQKILYTAVTRPAKSLTFYV